MIKFIESINLLALIKSLIYIIVAIIIYKIIKKIVIKTLKGNKKRINNVHFQRMKTIQNLILSIIKYMIIIITIVAILAVWGFNVTTLVAGLGLGTAIIGLAFQDLAKDLIAGFAIITEGQYEVGDTIEVDNFMGEVTSISLKTTEITNFKGAKYIVSNRYMDKVINYSENPQLAIVDISTPYEEKTDKVEKVLKDMIEEINDKVPNSEGDLLLWGIQSLSESSVVYRISVPAKSMKHFETERYLRKQIKDHLDKAGIPIPYNQIEVHHGK
ncbi:MAG: mechanosensitive ion channel family protein [Bacilli bacterium]|jgi:small conductance mechanosensitive channel|nr:mechanosensitive ion channel family protein [Bacilli bacterium]